MKRRITRPKVKVGLPPGTLIPFDMDRSIKTHIQIIDFDEKNYAERVLPSPDELSRFFDTPSLSWIHITGNSDLSVLEKIGEYFGIHNLVLEDVLNTSHRPKKEEYDGYLFIVLKILQQTDLEIKINNFSLIIGKNFVISFLENSYDIFSPIRDRIKINKGKIRKAGADYLAYALIDTVVDHYFLVMESIGEKIESLEDEVMLNPTPQTIQNIQLLKTDLLFIRKSVWPLREVLGSLERGDSPLMQDSTLIYIRDVYDHTIQVIDTIETYRDMISSLLDIYLSSLSNKMNEVIKLLTIISTIFMPLTFLAGLEGMNFRYMPELEWAWGYPTLLFLMLLIVTSMLLLFRKKKWI